MSSESTDRTLNEKSIKIYTQIVEIQMLLSNVTLLCIAYYLGQAISTKVKSQIKPHQISTGSQITLLEVCVSDGLQCYPNTIY